VTQDKSAQQEKKRHRQITELEKGNDPKREDRKKKEQQIPEMIPYDPSCRKKTEPGQR
jgi:hypothetical protein